MIPGSYRKQEVPYATCPDCTVAVQNPMRVLDYAGGEYRRVVHMGRGGVRDSVLAGQERHAKLALAFIAPRLGSVERHLDIGSGAGTLLRRAKEVWGCDGVGAEVDLDYLSYAGERGIASSSEWPDGPFDLVTIVHTLEHMPDPVGTLRMIRERLAGYLYVEVPADEYDIVHPFIFNERSLRMALLEAGLELVEIESSRDIRAWARRANAA